MSEMNPTVSDPDQREAVAPGPPSRVVAGAVDVALALHFAAAAFWWWLSPKGFPLAAPQFWTNSVLPYIAMGMAAAGLLAMHRVNRPLAAAVVAGFSAAWASAAIAARIVFPVSLAGIWILFLFVAATGAGLFLLLTTGLPRATRAHVAAAIAGAAIGILVVFGQIPPPPTTIPAEPSTELAVARPIQLTVGTPNQVGHGRVARFLPPLAQTVGQVGGVSFECRPLVEFRSTSSDRFRSLFARTRTDEPRLVGTLGEPSAQTFVYKDGATITLESLDEDEIVAATAVTPIASDTYSHLNTYCYFRIYARDSPALTFSPCGEERFAVLAADYPFGRPARFAYLDADGSFRVCEASSGEKGPFQTLGSGRLDRGEPLSIGAYNDGEFVASITLDDWSAQASTALSPTAGWGVPVNAIEFQIIDDDSDESIGIWITLAGTSIGRGFETVGHRAGTYRNRFSIRRATDAAK